MKEELNDLSELYKAHRKESQERRGNNRTQSALMLSQALIPFENKNGGAHLIVEGFECYIDFWPGTGKWISRKGKKGFGVRNLIKYINAGE